MFLIYRGHRCLSILFSLFICTGISQIRAEVLGVTFPYKAPKGDYVTRQDQYHTFRIPGMVVTGDGAILAFAEGRRGGGSDPTIDENAPIDMVLRRSTDQGRTWKPMQVIDSGFWPDGSRVDFADPTPVLDAMTQTVHLLYGQWPDRGPMVMKPGQSPDADAVNHVTWVRSSSDHGRSWSQRRQIDYPDEPSETNDGSCSRLHRADAVSTGRGSPSGPATTRERPSSIRSSSTMGSPPIRFCSGCRTEPSASWRRPPRRRA